MTRKKTMRRSLIAAIVGAAPLVSAASAHASGPLEYPDNGAASFSRGGAWLASANDPIAAHYNPAALALQSSGVSLDMNLAFQKTCFDRRGPGNVHTGPDQGSSMNEPPTVYRPACNAAPDYPTFLPSLSFAYRVSSKIGIGLAFVPPAAYPQKVGGWPDLSTGYNKKTGSDVPVPAPYRYMTLGDGSMIFFPTLSVGVEVATNLRVGAGFIWGFALMDVSTAVVLLANPTDVGDHSKEDVKSDFRAKDLFIPGAVASVDWSPVSNIDVAGWFRVIDAIRANETELTLKASYYQPGGLSKPCVGDATSGCSVITDKSAAELTPSSFVFRFPMEARVGIRYHAPRVQTAAPTDNTGNPTALPVRDPLHDDLYDVELNASWTHASAASLLEVNFPVDPAGKGIVQFKPNGVISPLAGKDYRFKDTWGLRLGGQLVLVQDKLALRAGAWIETASQDAADAEVAPFVVGAMRGGGGGGLVFRQNRFDIQIGYQRQWNAGLDNQGNGAVRANAGVSTVAGGFAVGGPLGDNEFRSYHAVNGGHYVQSANVFTLGAVARF